MCCKAAYPMLRQSQGTIINVSSCAALRGQNRSVAYSASKAGMVGLTKSLALELGPDGIRVNCVCPSNVDTPLMEEWLQTQPDPESMKTHVSSAQVLDRMGTIDEVGDVVAFLASEKASFLTGIALVLDGGATLGY